MNSPSLELTAKIESILFWKAEPVPLKKLASWLKIEEPVLREEIGRLEQCLRDRGSGLSLVYDNETVMLGTSSEQSALIQELTKEELTQDLSKAALETLSIILYQGPISRADLDYIRGVSSQFILRNLLIRGLVQRVDNETDARVFLYKPTLELLAHLGISKIEDLPQYAQVREEIESLRKVGGDDGNVVKAEKESPVA